MPQGELAKKKNDWILYAYIIQRAGGSTSIEEIKSKLTAWKKRNANSRRISQVMSMHQKKGFKKVEEKRIFSNGMERFVSIWEFNGDLPEIHRRTLKDWDQKLSP